MGTAKRARQKEQRRARLEAERQAAKRAKWRRRIVTGLVIAGSVVIISVVGNLLTGDATPEPAPVVTDTSLPGVTDITTVDG